MEVRDQFQASAALPPRKDQRYTLDRRLDGLQNCSGGCEKEVNLLALPEIDSQFLRRPALSLVSVLIELPRLSQTKGSASIPKSA
jgi:hypothetical protein